MQALRSDVLAVALVAIIGILAISFMFWVSSGGSMLEDNLAGMGYGDGSGPGPTRKGGAFDNVQRPQPPTLPGSNMYGGGSGSYSPPTGGGSGDGFVDRMAQAIKGAMSAGAGPMRCSVNFSGKIECEILFGNPQSS